MAGTDGFDGKGTIWVHDSPVGAPEREEEPPPAAPSAASAPAPAPSASVTGPPPTVAPVEAKKSGFGSTGCLLAVFALGGIGMGLVVILAIGVVGAAFYLQ